MIGCMGNLGPPIYTSSRSNRGRIGCSVVVVVVVVVTVVVVVFAVVAVVVLEEADEQMEV